MILLREFGNWVSVDLNNSQIEEIKLTSSRIKERLRLREEPIQVEVRAGKCALRARHISGFVQTRFVSIEIAPKFLDNSNSEEWQGALFAILARLGHLSTTPLLNAAKSSQGLADILGSVIERALQLATTEGLPRQYREVRGEYPALREGIDSSRLWRRILAPEMIPSRFDEFTSDTSTAQLLKWAATELIEMVESRELSSALFSHVEGMSDIVARCPAGVELDRVEVPLQYSYLEGAVDAAKILAEGESLSLGGKRDLAGHAFLWRTADLFEDFVFEIFSEAGKKIGAVTSKQRYELACRQPADGNIIVDPVTTEPDVVITMGGRTLVLDAKYKTLEKHPLTSDIYQVSVGALLLEARDCGLIYPAQRNFHKPRVWEFRHQNLPNRLFAIPIDLSVMSRRKGFEYLVEDQADQLARLDVG